MNIEPHIEPPEPPECPVCGEYLPTDYFGRLDRERAKGHVCNLYEYEEPPKRNYLRWILLISIAILLGALIAKGLFGQMPIPNDSSTPEPEPKKLLIAGGVWGKAWMEINRVDTKAASQRGWDPSYTYITVDYKPIVKKLKDGRWAIQFTSEIAEDLP